MINKSSLQFEPISLTINKVEKRALNGIMDYTIYIGPECYISSLLFTLYCINASANLIFAINSNVEDEAEITIVPGEGNCFSHLKLAT